MGKIIVYFVETFVNLMNIIVLVYCVMSWFVPYDNSFRIKIEEIMNIFLDPIRKHMPNTGMIDLSPFVFLILLQILEVIIKSIL